MVLKWCKTILMRNIKFSCFCTIKMIFSEKKGNYFSFLPSALPEKNVAPAQTGGGGDGVRTTNEGPLPPHPLLSSPVTLPPYTPNQNVLATSLSVHHMWITHTRARTHIVQAHRLSSKIDQRFPNYKWYDSIQIMNGYEWDSKNISWVERLGRSIQWGEAELLIMVHTLIALYTTRRVVSKRSVHW